MTVKTPETKKRNDVDSKAVKAGDLMAFTYYANVKSASTNKLLVEDLDNGNKFYVEGEELLSRSLSADQFKETKKVTKTEAAEILVSSHNIPFTVQFVKEGDGESRLLRGRLVSAEPLLGRSYVEDLDKPRDTHRLRQVDHRTIEFLIVNCVKYVVK